MSKILTLALNTFKESSRSAILYIIIFLALALILLSTFFGAVSVGDMTKVIKDFGLFSMSAFSVVFAVLFGTTLIQKEISLKTSYSVLAKPLTRSQFLVGKFLGLYLSIALIVLVIGLILSCYVFIFEAKLDTSLFIAYLYILLEAAILSAAVIFFSAIVITPILSGIFTLILFIVGRSIDAISFFIDDGIATGLAANILEIFQILLPNLSKVYISDSIVHGNVPGFDYVLLSVSYCLGYTALLLMIASVIFKRRELN